MNRIRNFLLGLSIILILQSCMQRERLINSPGRIADIQQMLSRQRILTAKSQTDIWKIFDTTLSPNEKQALEFLYAYMPISDMADYSPSFFLANVKMSLKAKREMPWGDSIPEGVFLHFVLPMRVNNENLDSFRLVMYPEIKNRIKGLSLHQAALEINHWCHEKVTYRGTDIRTSAPLSTIKRSYGRCGEESTFTVASLRTAGIPARQVYTPRWAHMDDNHAWVEVWVNGKWYYMGACEPEPELNIGWFTKPSKRAMMVHTRTYGKYFGADEVITREPSFSELNLTASYAPVKTIYVQVKTRDGNPAKNARIDFGLYNYAEFYPIATRYADRHGITRVTTGLGDLRIWSTDGKYFGYRVISVPATDTVRITLQQTAVEDHTETHDLIPPFAIRQDSLITEVQRIGNNLRLKREDSIRNDYMRTFKDSIWSVAFARKLDLDPDTVVGILQKACGNWPEIVHFMQDNAGNPLLLPLLTQISEKDAGDVPASVLTDQLVHTSRSPEIDGSLFFQYVLSPRIANEKISPWRGFLKDKFAQFGGPSRQVVERITDWIEKNITVNDSSNILSRNPLTPIGTYNLRVADHQSRDIFFVAVCRALGIPARINPVDGMTEYAGQNGWQRSRLNGPVSSNSTRGYILLTGKGNPVTPRYYIHFTLARLASGIYKTLAYDEDRELSDFPHSLPVDTGHYLLITGNRQPDGSVLNSMTFFHVTQGAQVPVTVTLRREAANHTPMATLDLHRMNVQIPGTDSTSPVYDMAADGLAIVYLDPEKEPSKHVLQELGAYADHFNHWKGKILLVVAPEKSSQSGILDSYPLPANKVIGVDADKTLLKIFDTTFRQKGPEQLPFVTFCDRNGSVFLFSAGYQIGIGEQLIKLIR